MSRCGQCKHYGALHEARKLEGGSILHGFCFKDFKDGHRSAYPVYLPDGGVCKQFKKSSNKQEYEYEMTQEFKCDCCKDKLRGLFDKMLSKI